jgi:3-methyladenine DNA glycosylase/8-oxoguanine DNA glycosylase
MIRSVAIPGPFDLAATWAALMGPGGSTSSHVGGVFRYAARNQTGPVQLIVRRSGATVDAEAWGSGAAFELERLPRLLGLDDDPHDFPNTPRVVAELASNNRGLHLGSTGRIFEALAPTVLGQRVTSKEAKRSYYSLVREYGEPAPGPAGLRLPPAPERLAGLAYEEFHRHGIERSRADILREAARRAKRLDAAVDLERAEAYSRLHAIRGIGAWTSGHVMGAAWGDRDAVPVGDFHLPNTVAWLLAGEARADDDRMLALIEPYRPQRRRLIVLVKRSGVGAPKFGAKAPIHDIRLH